jgi:AcrR family transcriptional regulator
VTIRVARKRADAYQHGDLRAALIQAGLKLLGEQGVPGLSLRAAAQLAGVSHAAPYRHFRDKAALVFAIAEEGFRLLSQRMRTEIAACPSSDYWARVRACAVGYVSFALERPAHFKTIFGGSAQGLADGDAGPPDSLRAAGDESYAVLRELIAEGTRRGKVRSGDIDQLCLSAWALVHGLGMLIIDIDVGGLRSKPHGVRETTETLIRFLEGGLRK